MDGGKKDENFLLKKVKDFCQLKTVKHIGFLVALLALRAAARFKTYHQF